MNFDQRSAVIGRLAVVSRTNPRLYTARVVFWILLGYFLLFAIASLALSMGVGTVILLAKGKALGLIKIAWIPLVIAWMVIRALFVKIEPPAGRVVKREEAPAFFELVDEVRRSTGVGALTDIRFDAEFNAAVAEVPRAGGLFGWRRHLVLGLPMVLVHGPDELRAILAHEFGHLSHRHGRIGAWAWRVRESWGRLDVSFSQMRGWIAGAMRKLVHWYAQRIFTVTIVQSRDHELGADRMAAEITSRELFARSLAWNAVAGAILGRSFWSPYWSRADEQPEPAEAPYALLHRTRGDVLAAGMEDLYEAELARPTALDDTHPSLGDRLAALGYPRPTIGPAATSAAAALMPDLAAVLIGEFDAEWRREALPNWTERHRVAQEALTQLAPDAPLDQLADEQLRAHAISLSTLGKNDEALAAWSALRERDPHDAQAAFGLGCALLNRNDLLGLDHLRSASADWRFTSASCDAAYAALRERGLEREADEWIDRVEAHRERLVAAEAESLSLTPADRIAPPSLSAEVIETVMTRLRQEKWIRRAWIGKKSSTILPGLEVHFVALEAKTLRYRGADTLQKLADSVAVNEALSFIVVDTRAIIHLLEGAELRVL